MQRVVGWDHLAFAGARHQGPPVVRLEAVVVPAETVEATEHRFLGVGPGDAVIDLGVRPRLIAPKAAARGLAPQQGDPLGRAGAATEMHD